MNVEQIGLLRKTVEWVEWQEPLPEIDREWCQSVWYAEPTGKAATLLSTSGFLRAGPAEYYEALKLLIPHCGSLRCAAGYLGALLDDRFVDSAWFWDREKKEEVEVQDYVNEALGLSGTYHTLWDGHHTAASFRREAERVAGEPL